MTESQDGPQCFIAPQFTPLPTERDGSGRPVSLTPDGVTRWVPFGPFDDITEEDA